MGAALVVPRAEADPPGECEDPSASLEGCAVELDEEFTSTSFSTTALGSSTNYSILFSTRIPNGQGGATGYRIESLLITGEYKDGTPFSLKPAIGERGPRVLGAISGSSLGFTLDVPWNANELVREFQYNYDVVFLNWLTEARRCTYVTTMSLDDNGRTAGGVGSVKFSRPRLTACSN